ncbi:MAG TPA: 5-formyltetrahydrofolate cyclo-ligase [Bacteroidales bacterium]|nr:MAG: 5-formyltetrahydrofolate cyclo-ligase [Bacteroidetes bacterium GWE2_42_24]OFY30098.1 MAG: 5-formyltetrahydrofolate cyclo-ligase [Bacteroidetes bacterium GWF2_43_11]HAQ64857.1 5-formyltetrahydrofolate cyclo-ligase [Bacteroidales bacterium]HBZ67905.1 5-formyltetrahydrofolate cyclo-ligase [Bacteroidales bacterium]
MNTTDEKKKELRKTIRQLKQILTPEASETESKTVFNLVESLDEFKAAKCIMVYWAMKDELPTRKFIEKWFHKKQIILPSVDGNKLRLKEFKGTDTLHQGDLYAIPEPIGPDFETPETIDLIIVPGVAFDPNNNRMGRGKAYYDELLSHLKCFRIGVGFRCQLIDEVPTDVHDIKMNIVVAGEVKTGVIYDAH